MNGTLPLYEHHPLPEDGQRVYEFYIFRELSTSEKPVVIFTEGVASDGYMETQRGDKFKLRPGKHHGSKIHAYAAAVEELLKIKGRVVDLITELMEEAKESEK